MSEFDYQRACPIDTPVSQRRKLNIGDIFDNSAECLVCGDIVRSRNRHHMIACKCGAMAVDGGSWYTKIVARNLSEVKTHTIMYKEVISI